MSTGTTNVKTGNRVVLIVLGALITISPFSIDMYLPAFSKIAADFGTTTAKVALSLSSYFVGMAIGQILYGPLLDRFGRKKPLYYRRFIYIVSSIGCAFADSVGVLVTLPF